MSELDNVVINEASLISDKDIAELAGEEIMWAADFKARNSRNHNNAMFRCKRFYAEGIIQPQLPYWYNKNHDQQYTSLSGTVMALTFYRKWYSGPYTGENKLPDCYSLDTQVGYPNIQARKAGVTGECNGCPNEYFGKGGCGLRLAVFVIPSGEDEVIGLDIPPTSVFPVEAFFDRMAIKFGSTFRYETRFEFEKSSTKNRKNLWKVFPKEVKTNNHEDLKRNILIAKSNPDMLKLEHIELADTEKTMTTSAEVLNDSILSNAQEANVRGRVETQGVRDSVMSDNSDIMVPDVVRWDD